MTALGVDHDKPVKEWFVENHKNHGEVFNLVQYTTEIFFHT